MLRICLVLVLFGAINAYGHEGPLDPSGGHMGEGVGTYHFHNRQVEKLEIESQDNKKILKMTLIKEVSAVILFTVGHLDTSEVIVSGLKKCEKPVGESKEECIARVKDLIIRTEKAAGAGKIWHVDLAKLQLERSIPRILHSDYDYVGQRGSGNLDPSSRSFRYVPEDGSYAILGENVWLSVGWINKDGTTEMETISIYVKIRETRKIDGPSERKIDSLRVMPPYSSHK